MLGNGHVRFGRRAAETDRSKDRHRAAARPHTEHPTITGQKIYCCAIKDLFSNRIVGYAIDDRMTAQLAVNALRAAIARRQPDGIVIVHADRGSQFRARSFRAVLTAAGLQGSMGRVASAGDNAAMESFWALLQKNVLDRRRWRTRDELHYAIVHWIEHTYNRRRRQRGLGRLTPVEYEPAFNPDQTVTAANHPQPPSTRPTADPPIGLAIPNHGTWLRVRSATVPGNSPYAIACSGLALNPYRVLM